MENRNNNPIAEEIIHNNPTGYGLFAGIGDNFNSARRRLSASWQTMRFPISVPTATTPTSP